MVSIKWQHCRVNEAAGTLMPNPQTHPELTGEQAGSRSDASGSPGAFENCRSIDFDERTVNDASISTITPVDWRIQKTLSIKADEEQDKNTRSIFRRPAITWGDVNQT